MIEKTSILTNNLWVDDVRQSPEGWLWARNAYEAIDLLESHNVEFASLDHDLGSYMQCNECEWGEFCNVSPDQCTCKCHLPGPTGLDLLKLMKEMNLWPINKPAVHSMNPIGKQQMINFIEDFGPYKKE